MSFEWNGPCINRSLRWRLGLRLWKLYERHAHSHALSRAIGWALDRLKS